MASTPFRGLSSSAEASSARLAEQLSALAQVSETLTYRLLELEERVQAQEERLLQLDSEDEAGQAESIGERLGETEERLQRIEALLEGLEPAVQGRRLQPLPGFGGRSRGDLDADPARAPRAEGEEPEDPFYEEGEQPFMDERTA